MGCADSKLDARKRRGTISGRRNTIVTKPNVNINIGTGINIKKDKKTKVIFIFGKFNVVFISIFVYSLRDARGFKIPSHLPVLGF